MISRTKRSSHRNRDGARVSWADATFYCTPSTLEHQKYFGCVHKALLNGEVKSQPRLVRIPWRLRAGVVSARLSDAATLQASGALPQNVIYAVKSCYLLSVLESVPELSAKLKEPQTKERKFEDVMKSAEEAAVLVLVYRAS